MILHNLRAPLANALGLAPLLTKLGKDTDHSDRTLGHPRPRMSQANAVITDLNQVLTIRNQPALPEVCAQALASLALGPAQCGGQVWPDIAPGRAGRGTRAYLHSLFDNLLSNALKHRAAERPPRVSLRAVADGRGGFGAQLAGARVFQLYQRFHDSPPGRGIGLFVVKTHVEAMHGHLSVVSTVGEGTVFLLSRPAA